jgi:ribonucleoside-triphosphate reductase
MKVIKKNGSEATFYKSNIINAISNANMKVGLDKRFTNEEIKKIASDIETVVKEGKHTISTADIQDMVERAISVNYDVLKEYIQYRYAKELQARQNTTDDSILSLLSNANETLRQENSNKNVTIVSTMRDYMAGEVSKDLSKRYLIPSDIWDAHEKGIIHFHDTDYFSMPIHNCDLWNLEDMLQNGTMISGVKIDKPKSFSTACNIATQIVAQVASSQYGGQTFTLTHLAPFVDVSRKKFTKQIKEEFPDISEEELKRVVELRVKREIEVGVQTMNYQLITLQTTNGQTPFVTVFMYLNETDDEQTKADLALIIEEVLNQRILGVKNSKGQYVAPAFPKLIYALEEDNITEDSKYWYLTELAAKCSAKRLVPDYISEKKMKELKKDKKGNGYCYPAMGCRSFLTVYTTKNAIVRPYEEFNLDDEEI